MVEHRIVDLFRLKLKPNGFFTDRFTGAVNDKLQYYKQY